MAPHSVYACSTDALEKVKQAAGENNFRVHIHVSESEKEVVNCRKTYGKTPVEYMDLKSKIREITDWPKAGVNFKDITTLLEDKAAFSEAVELLAAPFRGQAVDKVVGIDARGFLLAAPVAYVLNTGLAIVRKKGKLPSSSICQDYSLEYASNTIEMHDDAIKPGENIILIDDLCATGGTALAACDLIERLGGKIMGVSFLIDLPFLNGSKKIEDRGYEARYLVEYSGE